MKYWTEAIYGEKVYLDLWFQTDFSPSQQGNQGNVALFLVARIWSKTAVYHIKPESRKLQELCVGGRGGVVLQHIQSPSCSKVTLAKPYLLNTSQPPKVWLYAREHTSKIWACAYQLVKTPNVTIAAPLGQHEVQTKQGSGKVIVYV